MKGRILTYTPGIPVPSELEISSTPKLEELQSRVGGYIEKIPCWLTMRDGSPCVAFCNEEGKLDGMPVNEAATLAWLEALERATGSRECNDVLVGPVIVITGDAELMESL